ncbi:MAG: molybdopterin-guanine dinucleotide biosynthesis protein B [Thermoplasmatales archaeon]|nr:MAG: molybdopterin-guanine dinucleotide biosynthesis protein B [Thermoplasmatales archaeon]
MKIPAVLGIYGESNAGKTRFIVKLIGRLNEEGFKVASIKITDKHIGIDTKGKDTWKHGKAGSKLVVLSSPTETDFLIKQNKKMSEIFENIGYLGNYDIIIVEGASDENIPKIKIGKILERENTILSYDGDFDNIIKTIKNEINKAGENMGKKVNIKVNGKQIALDEFPSEFIKKTIIGMLKSLKGVSEIKNVEIYFEI